MRYFQHAKPVGRISLADGGHIWCIFLRPMQGAPTQPHSRTSKVFMEGCQVTVHNGINCCAGSTTGVAASCCARSCCKCSRHPTSAKMWHTGTLAAAAEPDITPSVYCCCCCCCLTVRLCSRIASSSCAHSRLCYIMAVTAVTAVARGCSSARRICSASTPAEVCNWQGLQRNCGCCCLYCCHSFRLLRWLSALVMAC